MKKFPIWTEKTFLDIPGARWTKQLGVLTFPRLDGEPGMWEFLDVGEKPAVLFLGLTPQKKVITVNLFRFPVNDFCTELPGGTINGHESVEDAAKREFREETGYECENVNFLCRGYLWNGKSNAKYEIWVGQNCKKVSEIKLDPVEETAQLTVETMSVADIAKRIAKGDASFDPVLTHGIVALLGRGISL